MAPPNSGKHLNLDTVAAHVANSIRAGMPALPITMTALLWPHVVKEIV